MSSVNKVILLGHCGRDAEVRYMPSGQPVSSVSLATTQAVVTRTAKQTRKAPTLPTLK